jgi:hypothetical protein
MIVVVHAVSASWTEDDHSDHIGVGFPLKVTVQRDGSGSK